jgi:hypothetical protein
MKADKLIYFICASILIHMGKGEFWQRALKAQVTPALLEEMRRILKV